MSYGDDDRNNYGSNYGSKLGGSGKLWGYWSDLPQDIAEHLTESERTRVKYWSKPDPTQPLCHALWCQSFGALVCLPCFWPHLAIMCIPSMCCMWQAGRNAKYSAIAITDNTIEQIQLPYEICCIPGLYKKAAVKVTTTLIWS